MASAPADGGVLTSELLGRMEEMAREGDVSVASIVEVAGSRAHAVVLVILALPEALPLPVAGMSTLLGIPLMILATHLAAFGSKQGIPAGIARRKLPARLVRLVAGKAAPIMRWLEKLSRPRWLALARRERLLALVCLLLAFVVALPIPLGNLPPAACLLAIALGMVQRDGMLVAVGLAGTAALAGASFLAADTILNWVTGGSPDASADVTR
ncbi:exopolysaccharide biosynthesis protein [Roseomonas mucosa]|uniref:exopolysaccharide biosynthesis protein n=1 Tax=Roseomonas mucosa TaxID=207340 RepID=UPI0028CE7FEC|nr:exopolysaccharide biosynthesis protein [Roseomonas mucosa]HWL81602.1 exopolysaccharide biosynthesis protein [Roseomonas sp.]MDT8291199.1 exopolysaccharide biosynthesis protein [Roseomonas mucosa]MDT8313240.1 exopolysaccharide biosynthesis protein [Roseomonas mucosa]MDT8349277.1 exopolysaccharide biosynthesis protein [Roseomonas mucosa]MDT8359254.1 exopolysaccharide biosynthesis protein [Roseomonas mucosa]